MAIGLTVLLCLVSAGLLAGRIYEILKLTDPNTGFFIYKGIIFNPVILIIFAVITICCGIIIFGNNKEVKSFFSQSSKIIAAAAGIMLLIYGVMSVKNNIASLFILSGAVAMIVIGIFGLEAKADFKNIAVIILTSVFIVGLCLDSIAFDVSTIYNVEFIKNALSYITLGLFFIFVMKNVYSPSKNSAVFLYITGILAFTMCGIMNLADIIVMVIDGNSILPDLFMNAGFAFIGFFALDNAVSVLPSKKEKSEYNEINEEIGKESFEQKEEEIIIENNIPESQQFADIEKRDRTENVIDDKSGKDDVSACFFNQECDAVTEKSVEIIPKKMVFSKKGMVKTATSLKDVEKVVYKRPKN